MPIKKQYKDSHMFEYITHSFNIITGGCQYQCSYCSVNGYGCNNSEKPLHFHRKDLEKDLGNDNFYFLCSGIDLFAPEIKTKQIIKIIDHCKKYPKNKYLFHTKNPKRFHHYEFRFDSNMVMGCTIESDIHFPQIVGKAPTPKERIAYMMPKQRHSIFKLENCQYELIEKPMKMITIEPIMKFTDSFAEKIIAIKPDIVNVGADSQGNGLPEPAAKEINALISELKKNDIKVHLKKNLARLL